MLVRIGLLTALAVSCAAAQTPPSSPPPPSTPATPATQPSRPAPPSLHSIVALMREEQWDKASEHMDKLYAATPADQRIRPMVLDRALLDLRHSSTLPRAVKELSEYLIKHPAEDEPATNILG